jgi:hypothetical protein
MFCGISFVLLLFSPIYVYMHWKSFTLLFFFLLKFHNYSGCGSQTKTHYPTPAQYDLNTPYIMNLNGDLSEISGISFYPKDSSIFSIVDEAGTLYKTYLNRKGYTEKWHFNKKHDYEDVVLKDSTFYVLISNGNIEKLRFRGRDVTTTKDIFPNADKNDNEFESLYYDDQYGKFILLCKNCGDDDKSAVSAWGYSPDSGTFTPRVYTIDVTTIAKKLQVDKLHFKPSAAAINPATNELFILASVNKLLLIADRNGHPKEVYELNPRIYKQPEGLAFTPTGDLLISNEANDYGTGTLLILKRKPTGK